MPRRYLEPLYGLLLTGSIPRLSRSHPYPGGPAPFAETKKPALLKWAQTQRCPRHLANGVPDITWSG